MIKITAGQKHEILNASDWIERERIMVEVQRMLNAAAPRITAIAIYNRTKTATVAYTVTDGKLHITVTNEEEDAKFKLE